MNDIDDVLFMNKTIKTEEENVMAGKKIVKKVDVEKEYGIGLDVGTGFICSAGFDKNNKVETKSLRDAFYTIPTETFQKQVFNKNQMKYVEIGDNVHIVGEDAITLACIQNTVARRPLSVGVINPKERNAAPILKEMFRYCLGSYKKKEGETLVFSVPGPKIGDVGFNIEYHSMSIQSLAKSLGLEPVPLNEAYAVIISELEKADNVTGLGFSFGAGLVNVAFVYKSMLMFEFSIDKSGDYIDRESSQACGVNESMLNHLKENKLDLSKDEYKVTPEERALMFTYRFVIKNAIKEVVRAFTETSNVNVIESIPIVISGGTSMPKGFLELFENEWKAAKIPFEYSSIIPAKDKLTSVSRGCLLWANHIEKGKK
jgi:hypothetical protein